MKKMGGVLGDLSFEEFKQKQLHDQIHGKKKHVLHPEESEEGNRFGTLSSLLYGHKAESEVRLARIPIKETDRELIETHDSLQ